MKRYSLTGLVVIAAFLVHSRVGSLSGSSVILSAMENELKRNLSSLQLEGYEKPYYVSYHLVDRETLSVSASLGALLRSSPDRNRVIDVDVRVGDYVFDSSKTVEELWDSDEEEKQDMEEYRNVPVSQDNDENALKTALWRLTDIRYKRALAHFLKKKGKAAQLVQEKDRSNDFSKEDPQVFVGDPAALNADKAAIEKKLTSVSSLCKSQPALLSCTVSFSAEAMTKYFVDTEGSKVLHGKTFYRIYVSSSAKADDGMWVESYRSFFAWNENDLPDETKLKSTLKQVMDETLALKQAPKMEAYVGPAIILSPASGVFFHEILGHRLEGHRQESKTQSETFKDKIGKKITAEFLTIVDDPSLNDYRGEPMGGHFLFDDEGVRSRRTLLVENGILKSFLISRKPIKNFPRSNGHGRAQLQWMGWGGNDTPVPRMANFIVENSKPLPLRDLKKLLLEQCQIRQKKFGLIMSLAEYGFTQTSRWNMDVFVTKPLLVYKVDAKTGKEQLVRGVKLGGTPLVGLDKVIAAGDDVKVFHGYCGAESGSVPQDNAAPSILLSELEIAKVDASKAKPPVLPYPEE